MLQGKVQSETNNLESKVNYGSRNGEEKDLRYFKVRKDKVSQLDPMCGNEIK